MNFKSPSGAVSRLRDEQNFLAVKEAEQQRGKFVDLYVISDDKSKSSYTSASTASPAKQPSTQSNTNYNSPSQNAPSQSNTPNKTAPPPASTPQEGIDFIEFVELSHDVLLIFI